MKIDASQIQRYTFHITQRADLLLAALLVGIIALMILPIPTFLLDTLLAINLGMAASLLLVATYIPSAVHLSVFPSLLLFTTLYRLALNITTTRLILLKAHAGAIIYTFGHFVVAGNYVVGAVIFLIITLVQFLVITKGAERVSEVAARFTLDAMPGKQMSIDSDMRAGLIDMEEARRRRRALERESQLFGAMDGAMKFVKGDAIAGLIITSINIVGGLIIGVLQKGMPLIKAVQTYSILTIGDGLVSQIPALLISITAGVVVTRVSSDEEEANLGRDIGRQMLSQPKALMIAGVLLVGFALIPGFPKPQFIILGAIVGAIGYGLYRPEAAKKAEEEPEFDIKVVKAKKETSKVPEKGDEFSITIPLLVDIDASAEEFLDPELFNTELIKLRRALYHDLGVPFPGIHLRFNENITRGTYIILLQEIPAAQGVIKKDFILVREKEYLLQTLNVEYVKEEPFLPHTQSLWVRSEYKDAIIQAGFPYLEHSSIITFHLSFLLRKHADEFIGLQETRFLLDRMEAQFPELVKEVSRILPIQRISEIFQRLVQEQISIRDLRTILEALIEWGQKEKDTVLLTEYVRNSLRRYISYKYSGGRNVLAVYLLDPDVEEMIRQSIRQTSAGSYLALDPVKTRAFVDSVKQEVGEIEAKQSRPVLLTSMDIRRYVRKLIETDLEELPVLSYQELTPEISVQPLGRIRV
ncbi:MAG: type III secretion system export apparatus subunit SctV [Deltaproteobacteria bacterium]|nr:type III secretion system export apparatus subunit SctV [Deltaproteobacteria bacterium]